MNSFLKIPLLLFRAPSIVEQTLLSGEKNSVVYVMSSRDDQNGPRNEQRI